MQGDLSRELLAGLTPEQVESVYEGRSGKCCCGCAGEHYRDEANIRRILRSMQREARKEGNEVEFGSSYISRVKGPRIYIVYPRRAGQES